MVLSSSVHGFTFRVALLGAALTVSCGLGASGSGIARSPPLQTWTDHQDLNAPFRHLPLIRPVMWSAGLRGQTHLAVRARPLPPLILCSLQ